MDRRAAQYLDISLFKDIGTNSVQIHELENGNIRITIEVPESLKNTDHTKKRKFVIIRVHDGAAALLSDLDDSDDGKISGDKIFDKASSSMVN